MLAMAVTNSRRAKWSTFLFGCGVICNFVDGKINAECLLFGVNLIRWRLSLMRTRTLPAIWWALNVTLNARTFPNLQSFVCRRGMFMNSSRVLVGQSYFEFRSEWVIGPKDIAYLKQSNVRQKHACCAGFQEMEKKESRTCGTLAERGRWERYLFCNSFSWRMIRRILLGFLRSSPSPFTSLKLCEEFFVSHHIFSSLHPTIHLCSVSPNNRIICCFIYW